MIDPNKRSPLAGQLVDPALAELTGSEIIRKLIDTAPEPVGRHDHSRFFTAETDKHAFCLPSHRGGFYRSHCPQPRAYHRGITEQETGDRCFSAAIDVDSWGARIQAYGMTYDEATELRNEVIAAVKTVQGLGYTFHGGEQWKPPLGPARVFDPKPVVWINPVDAKNPPEFTNTRATEDRQYGYTMPLYAGKQMPTEDAKELAALRIVAADLLEKSNAGTARIAELEAQVKKWKNNHRSIVERSKLLRQRLDLPVDRIPAFNRMEGLQKGVDTLNQRNNEYEGVLGRAFLLLSKAYWDRWPPLRDLRQEIKTVIENRKPRQE